MIDTITVKQGGKRESLTKNRGGEKDKVSGVFSTLGLSVLALGRTAQANFRKKRP